MYCRNCGAMLKPDFKYCNSCGAQIQDTPTNDNYDSSLNSMQQDYCIPVEQISKKEYLSTKCSNKCRKLIKASWIVWIISLTLMIILTAFSLTNFAKINTGGVYFNDQEVEAPTVERYSIVEVFELLENADSITATFVLISLVWIFISLILTITFGALACKTKNVPLAVIFLVVSFSSALPSKLFDVLAAICILIFNVIINKEYKVYLGKQINPNTKKRVLLVLSVIASVLILLILSTCGSLTCHRCGDSVGSDPVKAGGRTYCSYDCYMDEVFF